MQGVERSVEIAKCFTYEKLEYYCPRCGMKLRGNLTGSEHVDESESWGRWGCDYSVGSASVNGSYSQPISTAQVLEWRISKIEAWFSGIPKERKIMKNDLIMYQELLKVLNVEAAQ